MEKLANKYQNAYKNFDRLNEHKSGHTYATKQNLISDDNIKVNDSNDKLNKNKIKINKNNYINSGGVLVHKNNIDLLPELQTIKDEISDYYKNYFSTNPFFDKPTNVECVRLTNTAIIPKISTKGSAAYDLFSDSEETTIQSGDKKCFSTGIVFSVPPGYVGFVKSRSSLKNNVNVEAFHGTIDSDYTGELKIILDNHDKNEYTVYKGDKIAQIAVVPCLNVPIKEISSVNNLSQVKMSKLNKSENFRKLGNDGGFGSTGRK